MKNFEDFSYENTLHKVLNQTKEVIYIQTASSMKI